MTHKISSKIVSYKVVRPGEVSPVVETKEPEGMHEKIKRGEVIDGSTYKITTPESDHALYITINDVMIDGARYPYEIFINSKTVEHFQWVTALTLVLSAVFRKGGDVTFLAEELKEVFSPRGGYFKKGRFIPSMVAEIGMALEDHLIKIGLMEKPELTDHVKAILAEKREEFEARHGGKNDSGYPEQAVLCSKCNTKAAVLMDGCLTCLHCGESKCG